MTGCLHIENTSSFLAREKDGIKEAEWVPAEWTNVSGQ